jgi:hypothetical protein
LPILAERGYLIPAIDTDSVDYLSCAIQLAKSIRQWHPDTNIAVVSVKRCSDPVFDHVLPLPYGDSGGYANDWQCHWLRIDHWWTLFEKRDVVISQGARTFYNDPAISRFYRKIFDENSLPDVYNAVTYWRVSRTATEFFKLVRSIFENWADYKRLLKFPDDDPTTDVVYAIAAVIIGEETVTLPPGLGPTIVHMKQHINRLQTEDWTQELIWENNPFRINTVAQWGLVHYHVKDWHYE